MSNEKNKQLSDRRSITNPRKHVRAKRRPAKAWPLKCWGVIRGQAIESISLHSSRASANILAEYLPKSVVVRVIATCWEVRR